MTSLYPEWSISWGRCTVFLVCPLPFFGHTDGELESLHGGNLWHSYKTITLLTHSWCIYMGGRENETRNNFLWNFISYFLYQSLLGNINSHFTFSPNAGSNVSHLLLATPFDYIDGLDKIWDYKLLVYITDDNMLSGRKKAEAFVETGTVTLNIRVIPHPTTIVTTTPKVRA